MDVIVSDWLFRSLVFNLGKKNAVEKQRKKSWKINSLQLRDSEVMWQEGNGTPNDAGVWVSTNLTIRMLKRGGRGECSEYMCHGAGLKPNPMNLKLQCT